MKQFSLLTSFLICVFASFSQTRPFPNILNPSSNDSTLTTVRGGSRVSQGYIETNYPDTGSANLSPIAHYSGAKIFVNDVVYVRNITATKWLSQSNGGGGGIVNGTAITSLPSIGFVPNQTNPADWIDAVFYQSQVPTATLTGGGTLSFQSAATLNYTLNYSASRQGATDSLATIIVAGISKSFTQPSAPGTVSGTQSVSFPSNTNITYSNVVTTTDSKTSIATTIFAFSPYRYFGWINISDTAGLGTFGYDDSKITSLSNELTFSNIKGGTPKWDTGDPTGTQIYVYAYYYTAGQLNTLIANGFPSKDAFNEVQRNFTTAEGFTGQWIIYWNKQGQTLSSELIAN